MSDLLREADLLIECMDDEIAERTRKKLRGSVAVLRTFRNMAAAIRDKLALAAAAPPPDRNDLLGGQGGRGPAPRCNCKVAPGLAAFHADDCPMMAPVPPAAPQPAAPIHYHTTILWNWGEEQVPCKVCGWPARASHRAAPPPDPSRP